MLSDNTSDTFACKAMQALDILTRTFAILAGLAFLGALLGRLALGVAL